MMLTSLFSNNNLINHIAKSLITFDLTDTNYNKTIINKVRVLTVIIDRLREIVSNNQLLNKYYGNKLFELETEFITMTYSLCSLPKHLQPIYDTYNHINWTIKPYKLPSFEIQKILIPFWSKYHLLPQEHQFCTVYLVGWLADFPFSKSNILSEQLINIIKEIFINNSEQCWNTFVSVMKYLSRNTISKCNTCKNTFKRPSKLLCDLLEQIPIKTDIVKLIDNNFNYIIKGMKTYQFLSIISRIFEWKINRFDKSYFWLKLILNRLNIDMYWNLDNVIENKNYYAVECMLKRYKNVNYFQQKMRNKYTIECSEELDVFDNDWIMIKTENERRDCEHIILNNCEKRCVKETFNSSYVSEMNTNKRRKGKIIKIDRYSKSGYIEQIGGIDDKYEYKFEFKEFKRFSLLNMIAKRNLIGLKVEFEIKIVNKYDDLMKKIKCVAVNIDLDIIFHEFIPWNMDKMNRENKTNEYGLMKKKTNVLSEVLDDKIKIVGIDCGVMEKC
eukprot:323999_1